MVDDGMSCVTLAYKKQSAQPPAASAPPWSYAAPVQAGRLQQATRHAPTEGWREYWSRLPARSVAGEAVKFMGRGHAVLVAGALVQAPAVAAVVDALAQQPQAAQPTGDTPAVQQQPPRHRWEAQSKLEAHASPAVKRWHEPMPTSQARQPALTALGAQQKPPRQAPEAQNES